MSREVAVKLVTVARVDETSRLRFRHECQAVGALSDHPNIVTVYGEGETEDGNPYLIMAFHQAGSLAERIEKDGPVPWQEVTAIGVKLCGALESAHRHGVLHRDVKPENVLVSSLGEPVLADFGIARIVGNERLTASGFITGTLATLAPEILEGGDPSAGSDVYGLAATLWHLLRGSPAFIRGTEETLIAVITRIITQPPPDLTSLGVPAAVAEVLEAGLAKQPSDRPGDAREFGVRFQQAQSTLGLAPTELLVIGEPRSVAPVVARPAPIPERRSAPPPTGRPVSLIPPVPRPPRPAPPPTGRPVNLPPPPGRAPPPKGPPLHRQPSAPPPPPPDPRRG